MIDYKIDNGNVEKFCVRGDVSDVLTDISCLIGLCYGAIKKKNTAVADEFEEMLTFSMQDESFKATIFSSEFFNAIDEKKKALDKLKNLKRVADDSDGNVGELGELADAIAKILRWDSDKHDCK